MISGLHLLLTYRCTYACDHCFVFGSPRAGGTFTRAGVRDALAQAKAVRSIQRIYFEGGEPFLLYPVLLWGLEAARDLGFKTGVVTNAYWAETVDDAMLWLEPLARLGVKSLTVSDDGFHHPEGEGSTPAARALEAAGHLGLPAGSICVPHPNEEEGVRYRGRAADALSPGRPVEPAALFDSCPDEDLRAPDRVHLDASGDVHLCQGVLMGNLRQTPLKTLLADWDPDRHTIAGPLLRGGPAALAREHGVDTAEATWASACHLCFETRRRLRERFPEALGPTQVYEEP